MLWIKLASLIMLAILSRDLYRIFKKRSNFGFLPIRALTLLSIVGMVALIMIVNLLWFPNWDGRVPNVIAVIGILCLVLAILDLLVLRYLFNLKTNGSLKRLDQRRFALLYRKYITKLQEMD